jgi:hypothetical protein
MEKNKDDKHICRAKIETSVIEGVDFTCVASPIDNGQIKRSYENDEYFNEILLPTKENTRTERLDSGLPLFDNHPYNKNAKEILGISVAYRFTERGLELDFKLGARADEALKNDIKNGIIKTVSIEGDIHEYTVNREANKLPTYTTTDWEPTSLSFAPVPNDIASQIEVKRKISEQISKTEIKSKSIINSITNKF